MGEESRTRLLQTLFEERLFSVVHYQKLRMLVKDEDANVAKVLDEYQQASRATEPLPPERLVHELMNWLLFYDSHPDDQPLIFSPKRGPITADAGPTIMISPGRHRANHGLMKDPSTGEEHVWNKRHHVDAINDNMHPLHRKGFAKGSVFEVSKSRRWRRLRDLEVSPGVWR